MWQINKCFIRCNKAVLLFCIIIINQKYLAEKVLSL